MSDNHNVAVPPRKRVGSHPNLAVVIPMYNEVSGAKSCVECLLNALPALSVPSALIVVNDGSKDGTDKALDHLSAARGGFILVHQENRGYGGALIRGGREAAARGYDYVLFMDSDLTNPPDHIERFIPAMLAGYDLIKGSRLMQGGDMDAVPWNRRIFTIAGNAVARTLFRMGIADCTNGFRAIRTELFVSMPLTERGFAVIVEELYWADRKSTRLNSSHTDIYTLSLHDALPIYRGLHQRLPRNSNRAVRQYAAH